MTFSEPPTAAAVEKYIREILRAHPCSKSFSAGKSVLGRKISVLTLGEAKGGTLFAGATHGSEWLTSLVLLRFFFFFFSSFERGTRFYGIGPCRAEQKPLPPAPKGFSAFPEEISPVGTQTPAGLTSTIISKPGGILFKKWSTPPAYTGPLRGNTAVRARFPNRKPARPAEFAQL